MGERGTNKNCKLSIAEISYINVNSFPCLKNIYLGMSKWKSPSPPQILRSNPP